MIINKCWNCMENLDEQEVCPHCGFRAADMEVSPYHLKPDTILQGKYLVGKALGQGGFGITYIAYDLVLQMKVAIKEYFPMNNAIRDSRQSNEIYTRTGGNSEDWKKESNHFLSEARKMAKINLISEIVSVRDTFEENNTAYIVMDYVPGKTLKDYVKENGCFEFSECVNLLLPLILGLDEVHRQGIIHQDISPDNLMVSPNGKIYLLDLGAAKDVNNVEEDDLVASKRGFSPLEQEISNGAVGPWTDVYAMAATIYYCVYGKVLPPSTERVVEDALSFFEKTKKTLTKKQMAVMKKGLAVQKEMRYQYASEFAQALRSCVTQKLNLSKKQIAIISGVAVAIVLGVATWQLLLHKPWLPKITEYGAVNDFNLGQYLQIDEQYDYFVDLDGSMVRVTYDEEDETFYVDNHEVIFEQADGVRDDKIVSFDLIGDQIYFGYSGGKNGKGDLLSSYMYSMDLNGSDMKQVFEIENESSVPQYVKLSNGKEYFYYMMDDGVIEDAEAEEEEYHLTLYRYDLQKGKTEQVLSEEIESYVLHGKYLYYMFWDEELETNVLYRSTLAGKGAKLLDDSHSFVDGFATVEQLYLLQITDADGDYNPALIACDEKACPLQEGTGSFNVNWINVDSWAAGDGWLFYYHSDSGELRRVRMDGTNDGVVLTGYAFHNLSYHDGELYFQDGYYDEDGKFSPYQAYIAASDGRYCVSCGFTQYQVDERGVRYVIEDGEARFAGYEGRKKDVIVPLEFRGYPVNHYVDADDIKSTHVDVEDLIFYAEIPATDLAYKENKGEITITGYNGNDTGEFDKVAIPTEINGKPVTMIGEQAFEGYEFSHVYLPEKLEVVGEKAFNECVNLRRVVFPETLKRIETLAFYNTSFKGEDIVLPNSVEFMGFGCFALAGPDIIRISNDLTEWDEGFLTGCGGVYAVSTGNEKLVGVDGVVMSKDGTRICAAQMDMQGSYTVPEDVKRIEGAAFFACSNLTEVILPDGLESIGANAFTGCSNLDTVTIPDTVTEIGTDAFDSHVTILRD